MHTLTERFKQTLTAQARDPRATYSHAYLSPIRLVHFATTQPEYAQVLNHYLQSNGNDGKLTDLQNRLLALVRTESGHISEDQKRKNARATEIVIQNNPLIAPITEKAMEHEAKARNLELQAVQADYRNLVTFKSFLKGTFDVCNEANPTILAEMQNAGFSFDLLMNEGNAPTQEENKSMIEQLCTNLNEEAKAGRISKVIGRDKEIRKLAIVLGKKSKNNPALVGPAGVGKTAIPEGLALEIVEGNVPDTLKNAVIYSLEVASMMAGTSFRGQFEEKMQALMKEFQAIDEKGDIMPILFIDEIHQISGGGGGGGLGFADIIKPALAKGKLRTIGATTDAEWNKFINQEKALRRRFSQILVVEPTREETIEILRGAKKHYEAKHKLEITDEAIISAVDLSIEFITDSKMPDKSLDLLDYTGSMYRIDGAVTIGKAEVEKGLSDIKRIPLEKIQAKEMEKEEVKPIGPEILKEIYGQDQAVMQVVEKLETSLAGLSDDNKPIASFLFVGPTGVGKTELAKQIAKITGAHFARINMSEYMEKHAVSGLIGAPPGYVGYDAGAKLTQILEANPHCVLLLDEMEKAHPDIHDIFLQVMDEGRATDRQGNDLNFKNVVLLMTSNLGARELQKTTMGFLQSETTQASKSEAIIKNYLKPEFINRLDGIVKFNSLDKNLMNKVVDKVVAKLNANNLAKRGITLTLTPSATQFIVDVGYDANMGARPIERSVKTYIQDVLAQSILYGELKKGSKTVSVDCVEGKLKFTYSA